MSHELWPILAVWLLRVLVAGGTVLLATSLIVRLLKQPARRQRVADLGVGAALLLVPLCLVPSWLDLALLPPHETTAEKVATPLPQPEVPFVMVEPMEEFVVAAPLVPPPQPPLEPPQPAQAPLAPTSVPPAPVDPLPALFVGLFLAGSAWFLGRLAWGYWQLRRFLQATEAAPEFLRDLLDEMGGADVRLRISPLRVPLSCGIWRPTIVVPQALCSPVCESELRWVLAHELAHLRRRDALSVLLFGVARGVYFALPWFWWLRRQTQLCQEYVADAAAAEAGPVEDYAEFLLHWSRTPTIPVGATGVSGHSSDLFRRITMLVRDSFEVEKHCPRRWSLLAGVLLTALGVVVAGVGISHATAEDKKPTVKEDKKDAPKPEKNQPEIEDPFEFVPPGLDEETRKLIREHMEMSRRMLEQMRRQGGLPFPQLQPFARRGDLNTSDGRLGVVVSKPTDALAHQLELPRDQGLVIEGMKDDSPAAKAGLKQFDILLELDGKAVLSDVAAFRKQLADVKADKVVDAVVLRKSKRETIKGLKLPEAKVVQAVPAVPAVPPVPALPRLRFNGGNLGGLGGSTTIQRQNDAFTASNTTDGVTITVKGTLVDGKAKVDEIKVHDGQKTESYDNVEKVPAGQRDTVKHLIQASEGGRVRNVPRVPPQNNDF